MNDALYELIVPRKPKPYDFAIRVLMILIMVAVIIFGMPFIGFPAFIIAVIVAAVTYYFIFPRLNVEYEYILLNHDLQIDAIYNRSHRKSLRTLDIQNAEIIAPKGSPRLNSYRPAKAYDYSSGDSSSETYAIIIPTEQAKICIYIQPDAKMTELMSQWMAMKMYRD